MILHDYQQECLDALAAYFEEAAAKGAQAAFQSLVGRPYNTVPGLPPELPYVCLKVPTGGGKTLIAAHAVGVAAAKHLESEAPAVLWLAPTGPIVAQTLAALERRRPCRAALESALGDRVNPIPLSAAYSLGKGDLKNRATIIVATIQSLRAEATEGRKIYGDAGGLMKHFDQASGDASAALERADGRLIYSLANVLKLHRPMVVMDEAHNARTGLSFDSLARFHPSCIVEFTATPQTRTTRDNAASNVLHQVSAARLKQADMIKAPLAMRANNDAALVIRDAVAKQRELEALALAEERETGEYIRPIVLFQAGPAGSEMHVERLREALLDLDGVTEEQVAVAIGGRDELAGVDILARGEIRFIITVRKLGEGWDCPFAYVLCSVANIQATRAVEQILGRVLRLPGARAKRRPELNMAYAFAAHDDFVAAAEAVRQALVEGAGFNPLEAKDFVPEPDSRRPALFAGPEEDAAATARAEEVRPLKVPRLGIWEDGQLELLSQDDFLDAEWGLASLDAKLPRFSLETREGRAVIDIGAHEKVTLTEFASALRRDTALFAEDLKCELPELVRFVDRQFKHPDVPFSQSAAFIRQAINLLVEGRKIPLAKLAHHRFRLARAVARRVEEHRRAMRRRGLQGILTGMDSARRLETSAALALEMRERDYAPNWICPNSDIFRRHAFPGKVGELKESGEEFDCAVHLDNLPGLEVWVRNLDRRPATSFWIPTSTDLFYPDFVARLRDGRMLAVEYKGNDRWSNEDSREKRDLGRLWAERGDGKCVFVMACKQQGAGLEEINSAVAGGGG